MRKMQAIVVIIAVLAVTLGGAAWLCCGGWKQIGTHFEDDYASAGSISDVRVTGSVSVELRPSSSPGVAIHRTARYLNAFHSRPARTHRIDGTVLTLGGDDSSMFSVMEYVVTLPAGVRVTGETDNGSLDLTGVSTVDVKAERGSITVSGATGDVTMRSSLGSVTGKHLRSGSVVASSSLGAVELELDVPANVNAETACGAVTVAVPRGSYRVDALTGMGGAEIGIANDPSGRYHLILHANLGKLRLVGA
jgi:hypothetical protein